MRWSVKWVDISISLETLDELLHEGWEPFGVVQIPGLTQNYQIVGGQSGGGGGGSGVVGQSSIGGYSRREQILVWLRRESE